MIEQLSIDALLFPVEKDNSDRLNEEVEKWFDSFNQSKYDMMSLRTAKMVYQMFISILFYKNLNEIIRDIIEVATTLTYHVGFDNKYVYSFQSENHYKLCFNIGNKTLCTPVNDPFGKICFPASVMHYFDNDGNTIDFRFRDDFIMNDLGLSEHGTIRSKSFKHRDFCTLETDLLKVLSYWQDNIKKNKHLKEKTDEILPG